MLVMLYGGSACGKSAMGEELCASLGGRTLYVATMRPSGREDLERIARHQALRAHKGFDTMEYYADLRKLRLPPQKQYDALLLECTGNVVANGLFAYNLSSGRVLRGVLEGVRNLLRQVPFLVLITNDIFSDGVAYDNGTSLYLDCMARVNRELAALADVVIEVVCGLPIYHRGRGELPE